MRTCKADLHYGGGCFWTVGGFLLLKSLGIMGRADWVTMTRHVVAATVHELAKMTLVKFVSCATFC
jgi:hypothetical protein